jgi:hypothetical protein
MPRTPPHPALPSLLQMNAKEEKRETMSTPFFTSSFSNSSKIPETFRVFYTTKAGSS